MHLRRRLCILVHRGDILTQASQDRPGNTCRDTIFLNYNASVLNPNPNIMKNATSAHANMIATYELNYKKGKVIGLGIYSDVVINNRYLLVFLDHLLQADQPSK
jgi:hypothetical protein